MPVHKNGINYHLRFIKNWKILLGNDGMLLFEVGEGQAEDVKEMLLSAGFASAETRKDTLGTDRVVIGRMSSAS